MKTKKKIIDDGKSERKINPDETAKFLKAEKEDIKIEKPGSIAHKMIASLYLSIRKNKMKKKGDKK